MCEHTYVATRRPMCAQHMCGLHVLRRALWLCVHGRERVHACVHMLVDACAGPCKHAQRWCSSMAVQHVPVLTEGHSWMWPWPWQDKASAWGRV